MRCDSHPEADLLAAYLDGNLRAEQRTALEQHFCECGACRHLAASAGLLYLGPRGKRDASIVRWRAPLAVAASALLVAGVLWWRPTPASAPAMAASAAPSRATRPRTPQPSLRAAHAQEQAARPTRPASVITAAPELNLARPFAAALDVAESSAVASQPPPAAAPQFSGFLAQPSSTRVQRLDWGGQMAAASWRSPERQRADPAGNRSPLSERPTGATRAESGEPPVAQPALAALPASAPPLATPTSASVSDWSPAWPMTASFASPSGPARPELFSPPLAAEQGWAISPSGELLKSLATGIWKTVPIAAGVHFQTVFADANRVWAGGNASELFTSSDQGRHWRHVTLPGLPPYPVRLRGILFLDAQHGMVSAANGQGWVTSDAGRTWVPR